MHQQLSYNYFSRKTQFEPTQCVISARGIYGMVLNFASTKELLTKNINLLSFVTMFIDDVFQVLLQLKISNNWVGVGLHMDGWTLKKNFYGGIYIKKGPETPKQEALKAIKRGQKLQEFLSISQMILTVCLMDKNYTNTHD